jgi:hypothetical protein
VSLLLRVARAKRDVQAADVKWLTILAAIAASVVLAGCGTTTATQGSSGSSAAQAAPGIGAPVRDGKFEFVVLSVDRSKTAGPADDQSTAQGEFINVDLSVKNTGNEAQGYYATDQKLIINGKKFDAASIVVPPPQTQFSGGSAAPSRCLRQAGLPVSYSSLVQS